MWYDSSININNSNEMYNIVEPNVELCTSEGLEKIELIGKVCTKMEHNIKEGSAETFVINRIKDGHTAILIHEFAYFDVSRVPIEVLKELFILNPYIKYSKNLYYIAINYRSFLDLIIPSDSKRIKLSTLMFDNDVSNLVYSLFFKTKEFSSLFYDINIAIDMLIDSGKDNIYYKSIERVSKEHILSVAPEMFVVTMKFITDRGVSHEIVRHTSMAFMQESTRWCNYNKDKHGNAINIITPFFNDNYSHDDDVRDWYDIISYIGAYYKELTTKYNWRPEQARSILPNALKTEIYVTGTLSEWIGEEIDAEIGNIKVKEKKGFLPQRTAPQAHYQMRLVANMAKDILKENFSKYIKI